MRVETPSDQTYLSSGTTSEEPAQVAEFYESKVDGLKFKKDEANEGVNVMATRDFGDFTKLAITASRKSDETKSKITIGYGK